MQYKEIQADSNGISKLSEILPTMKSLKADSEGADGGAEASQASSQAAPEKCCAESGTASCVEEKIDFSNVVIEPLFRDLVDFDTFCQCDFRAVKVLDCEAVPKSKKLLRFTLNDGTDTPRTILSGIHAFYEPEELIGKTLVAILNLPPRPMMGFESCGMLISAAHKEGDEDKLHLLIVDPHIPAGAKLC